MPEPSGELVKCYMCNGTGALPYSGGKCNVCNGVGLAPFKHADDPTKCPNCGRRVGPRGEAYCPSCGQKTGDR